MLLGHKVRHKLGVLNLPCLVCLAFLVNSLADLYCYPGLNYQTEIVAVALLLSSSFLNLHLNLGLLWFFHFLT